MTIKYIWAKLFKKVRGAAIINSTIHSTSKIEPGSHVVNSTFGKHSFCGYDCEIANTSVGSFCSIANNVIIGGAGHPMEWVSTSPVFYAGRNSVKKKFSEFEKPADKRTFIGNDVWIGQYVLIKQGVKIGNGAVIGMGSVVTKDVPSYAIVAGNPAKLLRMRFPRDVINGLENSNWWDLPDEELLMYSCDIKDPRLFIQKILK